MDAQVASGDPRGYDEARMTFGRELVARGGYLSVDAVDRSGYGRYGAQGDGIAMRIAHGVARGLPPVMRARLWPDLPDLDRALAVFKDWSAKLAAAGLLDVLSIGAPPLRPAGADPAISPEEYSAIWRAARPMLVQRAAGSADAEQFARMLEDSIDIAWHEHSLWWFSALDGRGRRSVRESLGQRVGALKFIAETEKPFEPDVVRNVAAMGGDDLSCVLSGLVAAKAAKAAGIRRLILHAALEGGLGKGQGELAKARATLHLARELEDGDFKVYLQASQIADDFRGDSGEAKARLAAAVAMMDDIEPHDTASPHIVCVTGFGEGLEAVVPELANESIRIARQALVEYRGLRESGRVEDMGSNPQVLARTSELLRDARYAIEAIESSIPYPYSAEGLYEIMASGFFALPLLPSCREEFEAAVKWPTGRVGGAVVAVDESGAGVSPRGRIDAAAQMAKSRSL